MISCISNPPYNLKWEIPIFAQMQKRFSETSIPPKSNANYVFVLTALAESDKAVLILPQMMFVSNDYAEKEIRKYLVEKNLIEAVISLPDNMFESTSILTNIIVLNKNKSTQKIEFIDMSQTYKIEIRKQKGQYGSECHTNRIYEKQVKIIEKEKMKEAIKYIKEEINKVDFCKSVGIDEIKINDYKLNPTTYIERTVNENRGRDYEEIIKDLNRVTRNINTLKITINESLAKKIGLSDTFENIKKAEKTHSEIVEVFKKLKKYTKVDVEKESFLVLSKNKNEFKVENNDKEAISHLLIFFLEQWKQHIFFLNNEQNRYLEELKERLLPDLMDGTIDLTNIDI